MKEVTLKHILRCARMLHNKNKQLEIMFNGSATCEFLNFEIDELLYACQSLLGLGEDCDLVVHEFLNSIDDGDDLNRMCERILNLSK